jgi:4-diphosphocytidyl-2-C-methyl-D-erythritol kinase
MKAMILLVVGSSSEDKIEKIVLETYVAPAKINLGLEVLYKRPDGYHEINTLFLRIPEPHDTITVTRGGYFQLTCSDESLPTGSSNLMMRAAEAFCHQARVPLPRLHIHLEKNIPIGAGLGGGSSDAATILHILKNWYASEHTDPSRLNQHELLKLAAKLGADVPFFFVDTNAAQAGGIGEKLLPMDVKLNASVLVVFDPNIQVSTRDAYASLTPNTGPRTIEYATFFKSPPPLRKWKEQLGNDFEPEIFRQFPRLAEIKHSLYSLGASFALMSGSGSSVYGLFEDRDKAKEAKSVFEQHGQLTFLSE